MWNWLIVKITMKNPEQISDLRNCWKGQGGNKEGTTEGQGSFDATRPFPLPPL